MKSNNYTVLQDTASVDDGLNNILNEIIKANPESLPVAEDRKDGDFVRAVDTINGEVFNHIKDVSVILESDIEKLKKAQVFLFETYTDVRQFRPMISKLATILTSSSFPTIDSKYWQCKSEAEVHFNELQRDTLKWKRARVDINELDYKIESIQKMLSNDLTPVDGQKYDPNLIKFDLQRLLIKREEYELAVKQLEKTIKYRIEEVTDWSSISKSLQNNCKFSLRNPDEHLIESKLLLIEHNIKNAQDDTEKRMYEYQKDVLVNLVKSKTKKLNEQKEKKEE